MCEEVPKWSVRSRQQSHWLALTADRDSSAFRHLHRSAVKSVTASVRRIQPNPAQAEEIVQEVFIKVWHSAADFDPTKGMPSTWLGTIARNSALDSIRRQHARPRFLTLHSQDDESDEMDQYPSECPGTMEIAIGRSEGRSLCCCMERLPNLQRQSLALTYFHDLSHAEVAARLEKPLGTVKSWIRRSLTSLRDCMSESTSVLRDRASDGGHHSL